MHINHYDLSMAMNDVSDVCEVTDVRNPDDSR